jgi:hypothetical protein
MNIKDIKEIKARTFGSKTIATRDDDGYWKVVIDMTESLSFDGVNFEDKKLETMALDKSFEKAYDVALTALFAKFESETKGLGTMFTDLLEGKQKEQEKDDNSKIDKDTKS